MLLNYGYNDHNFKWGDKCQNVNSEKRQPQLDEVKDLMTLIEHRAEISDNEPSFNYVDEESKLDYIVEWFPDYDELEGLHDYILSDPQNIEYVLDSDNFDPCRLLSEWLELADQTQFENLWQYIREAEDLSDQLLDIWNEYVASTPEYLVNKDIESDSEDEDLASEIGTMKISSPGSTSP